MEKNRILSGWWYTYPSEKYEFVSWDDDIPNIWEHQKMFQSPATSSFCTSNLLTHSDSGQIIVIH